MYVYTNNQTHKYERPPRGVPPRPARLSLAASGTQDSAKGGAVETGCSDLYDVVM